MSIQEVKKELSEVNKKIDTIRDTNHNQNVILAKMEIMFEKQQEILDEHQRRSLASETRIENIEERQYQMDNTLIKHLSFVKGAIWLLGGSLGFIATGISIYGALLKFGFFS